MDRGLSKVMSAKRLTRLVMKCSAIFNNEQAYLDPGREE